MLSWFSDRWGALFYVAVLALGTACDELPEIPENVCGNGVREGDEACDTFATLDPADVGPAYPGDQREKVSACGAPTSEAACRYVWDESPENEDQRIVCPLGFVAGVDGVCRRTTLGFSSGDVVVDLVGDVGDAADLDGDGVDELVVTPLFSNQASIASFEPGGALEKISFLELNQFPAAIAQLTSEGPSETTKDDRPRADFVVPDFSGISVQLGDAGGGTSSQVFSAGTIPKDTIITALPAGIVAGAFPTLSYYLGYLDLPGYAFVADDTITISLIEFDTPAVEVTDAMGIDAIEDIRRLEWVAGPLEAVATDEVAVAYRQGMKSKVAVVTPDLAGGDVVISADVVGGLAGRVLVLRDGLMDTDAIALTTRAQVLYVQSAGDLGPTPYQLPATVPAPNGAIVLDVVDLVADGVPRPDLLLTTAGLYSLDPTCSFESRDCFLLLGLRTSIAAWTEGAFLSPVQAVAVGPEPGVNVLTLAGGAVATPALIATTEPVSNLTIGDFDGDGLRDLVGVQRSAPTPTCGLDDDLVVFWGALLGPPSPPEVFASLPAIRELASGSVFSANAFDDIEDLGVAQACPGPDDKVAASIFSGGSGRQFSSLLNLVNSDGYLASNAVARIDADEYPDQVALVFKAPTFPAVANDKDKGFISLAFAKGDPTNLFVDTGNLCGPDVAATNQCPPQYWFEPADGLTDQVAKDLAFGVSAALAGRIVAVPDDGEGPDRLSLFYVDISRTDDGIELRGAVRSLRSEEPPFGAPIVVPSGPSVALAFKPTTQSEELDVLVGKATQLVTRAIVVDADLDGDKDIIGFFKLRREAEPIGQIVAFAGDRPVVLDPPGEEDDIVVGIADATPLYPPQTEPFEPLVVATKRHVYLCALSGTELVCGEIVVDGDPDRGVVTGPTDAIVNVAVGDFDGDGAGDLAVFGRDTIRILPQVTR